MATPGPDNFKPPQAEEGLKIYSRESDQRMPQYTPPPRTPQLSRRDPSVTTPATSSQLPAFDPEHTETEPPPWHVSFRKFLHDKDKGTFCDRTCSSWGKIIAYAIMYLLFLATYTMMFLYFSLLVIKSKNFEQLSDDSEYMGVSMLSYSPDNIGLTGVPLSEHNYPLIWYRSGEPADYKKYVSALDELLGKTRDRRDLGSHLGPCGERPYGYGDQPCIVIKINKHLNWEGRPLTQESLKLKNAPVDVQKWVQEDDKKFWMHCEGFHNYDKEHIGKIKYYPDPPGFDSTVFPLKSDSRSPLVAFQISNFTLGVSLAIECKLWLENGASSVAFMLYVLPKSKNQRNASRW